MAINPSSFYLYNVIDTCSIWNLLSSKILFSRSDNSGIKLVCTQFVIYEALYKKRKNLIKCDIALQNLFSSLINSSKIESYSLSVEDLQDIEILEKRKHLGKGELSSLAFAKKSRLAFLSDDQKARKLAYKTLPSDRCQTIPHLFSWLVFNLKISDIEKDMIIKEHKENNGNIAKYLEEAYLLACEYRCIQTLSDNRN